MLISSVSKGLKWNFLFRLSLGSKVLNSLQPKYKVTHCLRLSPSRQKVTGLRRTVKKKRWEWSTSYTVRTKSTCTITNKLVHISCNFFYLPSKQNLISDHWSANKQYKSISTSASSITTNDWSVTLAPHRHSESSGHWKTSFKHRTSLKLLNLFQYKCTTINQHKVREVKRLAELNVLQLSVQAFVWVP